MRNDLRLVPPAPEVTHFLYADYKKNWQEEGVTFRQFLALKGYSNPAHHREGMDDRLRGHAAEGDGPALIDVPAIPVTGNLRVMVLLVDFPDREGTLDQAHYEDLLFSRNIFPTQSMAEYYSEVSRDAVNISGEVHGWFRMPRKYSYYTNNSSGLGNHQYPRDARRLAEHAVAEALSHGVTFGNDLDLFGEGAVTALFIVHAGRGAEKLHPALRKHHIWSHKWQMYHPQEVGEDLYAITYLMVPQEAHLGVCAHELGHLAFQWQDFYDPNYGDDGDEWDGNGFWDLMASGSYAGGELRPVHPAGLHKLQHGWIDHELITESQQSVVLHPITRDQGRVLKVRSSRLQDDQYLILENRVREDFDGDLPGEGLLVWRVDESEEMEGSQRPGMLLIQADGKHHLLNPTDQNDGDAGDPFPGSSGRTVLGDQGSVSTSYPENDQPSGIRLANIQQDPNTKVITLDVEIAE